MEAPPLRMSLQNRMVWAIMDNLIRSPPFLLRWNLVHLPFADLDRMDCGSSR